MTQTQQDVAYFSICRAMGCEPRGNQQAVAVALQCGSTANELGGMGNQYSEPTSLPKADDWDAQQIRDLTKRVSTP
jgi:hypothetical protein